MTQPATPFCGLEAVLELVQGRRVALVGSGPGVLQNAMGFVDSHDVVVRVNNYKLCVATGRRTDVYYSFFGRSVKKSRRDLKHDGVKLCMSKCPDAKVMDSPWHEKHGKPLGVDFRYIYELRKDWWFCPVYVPSVDQFMVGFKMLGGHVPTTGFAALLDILEAKPASIYMTGFDFFRSGVHNVNEKWKKMNNDDPIGHVPEVELQWLRDNLSAYPITTDETLTRALNDAS